MVVLRLFLLGLLLIGVATGVRNQWFQVNLDRLLEDIGLQGESGEKPFDFNQWLIGEPENQPPTD
ncbi:MAG: hypothetical protein CL862_03185 [Cyanobium sp. NAT70]|nr:hypothetical protein [Cyanobium sp. NAT70]